MIAKVESELGPIDLLVANAGIGSSGGSTWEVDPEEWWRVLEVNMLGVHLSCRSVIPRDAREGPGRIVITGSGASYLPGSSGTAYSSSKAAVGRYGETLANELRGRIPVFVFSPGLVKTDMTERLRRRHAVDAARARTALVHVLASGRADALAGRYLHAEHDDIEDLIARADEIERDDLNAIRLQTVVFD